MGRHPRGIELFESIYPTWNVALHLCPVKSNRGRCERFSDMTYRSNESGHVDLRHGCEGGRCPHRRWGEQKPDLRFNNLEILFSHTRRAMIPKLEECIGVGAVRSTPSTPWRPRSGHDLSPRLSQYFFTPRRRWRRKAPITIGSIQ